MDKIERTVVLPNGAKPLDAYGRNYAFSGPNTVVATYLIPLSTLDDENCKAMEHGSLRPCTKTETQATHRLQFTQTPAGQRRWFKNVRDLALVADGGCAQINFQYDMTTERVANVSCSFAP